MKVIRNNLIPVVIIVLAAALVMFIAKPLENTQFAETERQAFSSSFTESDDSAAGSDTESVAENDDPFANLPLILMIPLTSVKVLGLMGLGGILTMLGLWIARKTKRFRKPKIRA